MADRLQDIKNMVEAMDGMKGDFTAKLYGCEMNAEGVVDDFKWLIEQAETLRKIADTWIAIETNGTVEEAEDFYTFVQDTLSPEQLEDK